MPCKRESGVLGEHRWCCNARIARNGAEQYRRSARQPNSFIIDSSHLFIASPFSSLHAFPSAQDNCERIEDILLSQPLTAPHSTFLSLTPSHPFEQSNYGQRRSTLVFLRTSRAALTRETTHPHPFSRRRRRLGGQLTIPACSPRAHVRVNEHHQY